MPQTFNTCNTRLWTQEYLCRTSLFSRFSELLKTKKKSKVASALSVAILQSTLVRAHFLLNYLDSIIGSLFICRLKSLFFFGVFCRLLTEEIKLTWVKCLYFLPPFYGFIWKFYLTVSEQKQPPPSPTRVFEERTGSCLGVDNRIENIWQTLLSGPITMNLFWVYLTQCCSRVFST